MKRSLLIGGLIAGAFLMPTVASAAVAGNCANCHTMHNSQNGADILGTEQPYLLNKADCAGCHLGATAALRLDLASEVRNGGYFNVTDDTMLHNVSDGALTSGVDGNMANVPGTNSAYVQINCQSCHGGTGHHGLATSYRLLGVLAADDSAQTVKYGESATFPATRSEVAYDATVMNNFCAGCHGGFHGTTNQGAASPFVRHPTGISVSGSTGGSILTTAAQTDAVPMGAAATTKTVMCISCHVPHGGPYADLLSFNYAPVDAGDGVALEGCETCHAATGWGF